MEKGIELKLLELKDYIKVMENTKQALDLIYWDKMVMMPKKAVEGRSEVVAHLSEQLFNLQTSQKLKEFIDYFEPILEKLDKVNKSMVETLKKEYEETKKIPVERYKEFVILASKSEVAWEEAKEKNDFLIFKPYLEKIIEFQKEFIGYWGFKEHKYNTLLDKYEKGITVEVLDGVFGELRDALVGLLKKIKKSNIKIDSSVIKDSYPRELQKELSLFSLDLIGFDMNAGRLDESVHPFTTNFSNKDVRLTTHYYEEELLSALFSTIHEGGHGIYEQGISDELNGTWLAQGASMGVHESQSRFYENIVGRSKEFLNFLFENKIKQSFANLENLDFETFYKCVNKVEPSLIRTEADELTYSLHVIIRYEIEKAIFNGEVDTGDLPRLWNEKYKEYLGVEPTNDSEGILQDMHWSDGSFGYFPSYALGNLYGAQFLNTMKKDIPNYKELLEKGDIKPITKWLKEKIHTHGAVYSPMELLLKVTGEKLNPKYFIDYLDEKYSKIYQV
ncbi:carboxypeptidase M32 [Clostridium sp. 'White wine YQ']|uniref:carboxypeptidase M32 n=1 Tax=Clostridium sp. 'White wine YQ' TaxID=3027474 RepID=UPI002365464E|nr:carboxypeptidase M32 [Clostridium sp. 'White wine YQ']MDD7796131.1 carboxypeptidase M32 [Clostridium sp. 'White wine YQ']